MLKWWKERNLRRCVNCKLVSHKSELKQELWICMSKSIMKTAPRPCVGNGMAELYYLCKPCYRVNKQTFREELHQQAVRERAYQLRVERDAKKLLEEETNG